MALQPGRDTGANPRVRDTGWIDAPKRSFQFRLRSLFSLVQTLLFLGDLPWLEYLPPKSSSHGISLCPV